MMRSRSAWASSGWSQWASSRGGSGVEAGGSGCPGRSKSARAVLVAVLDRLQALPGLREVALRDAGPGGDVAPARGPERGQVARQHERGRVGGVGQRSRVDDEARPAPVAPVPGRRELDERKQAAGEEDLPPRLVRDALVAPDALADLLVRARLGEPGAELGDHLRLVEVRVLLAPAAQAHLADQLRVGRVLVRRGEVERQAHERRLDHAAGVERRLEVSAREAVEAGGERDVGRRRVLALQRREAADRLGGGEALPLDQPLAGGERCGQLRAGERPHRPQPTVCQLARYVQVPRSAGTASSQCCSKRAENACSTPSGYHEM